MGVTIIAGCFTTLNTILGLYVVQWKTRTVTVEPRAGTPPADNPGSG